MTPEITLAMSNLAQTSQELAKQDQNICTATTIFLGSFGGFFAGESLTRNEFRAFIYPAVGLLGVITSDILNFPFDDQIQATGVSMLIGTSLGFAINLARNRNHTNHESDN